MQEMKTKTKRIEKKKDQLFQSLASRTSHNANPSEMFCLFLDMYSNTDMVVKDHLWLKNMFRMTVHNMK